MRAVCGVVGALLLATPGLTHAQPWQAMVGIGVSTGGGREGVAGRFGITRSSALGFGPAFEAAYVTGAVADTGSFCGIAGCLFYPGAVQFGAVELSSGVAWVGDGAFRPLVSAGPYLGILAVCSSEFQTCADAERIYLGLMLRVGASANAWGRAASLELRAGRSLTSVESLGMDNLGGDSAGLYPTTLALFFSLAVP